MLLPGAGLFAARALAEAGQHPGEYTAEELAQVRVSLEIERWKGEIGCSTLEVGKLEAGTRNKKSGK